MPKQEQLETAVIQEIWWGNHGKAIERTPDNKPAKKFTVQFNPQSLKVNFSNQKAGGQQPKGSNVQFLGTGVTKLTLELWFDITLAIVAGRVGPDSDVRTLTAEVAYFMAPRDVTVGKAKGQSPPGLRFQWGAFKFEGVMDSMDETLDLFSADGKPLRASVSISVSKQEIKYDPVPSGTGVKSPGTDPLTAAKAQRTVQDMASEAGAGNWQNIALANGIENPRLVAAGTLLNMSAGVDASAQLGVSGGVGASAGVGASGGAQVGFSGGAQLDVSGSIGFGGGFGGGV